MVKSKIFSQIVLRTKELPVLLSEIGHLIQAKTQMAMWPIKALMFYQLQMNRESSTDSSTSVPWSRCGFQCHSQWYMILVLQLTGGWWKHLQKCTMTKQFWMILSTRTITETLSWPTETPAWVHMDNKLKDSISWNLPPGYSGTLVNWLSLFQLLLSTSTFSLLSSLMQLMIKMENTLPPLLFWVQTTTFTSSSQWTPSTWLLPFWRPFSLDTCWSTSTHWMTHRFTLLMSLASTSGTQKWDSNWTLRDGLRLPRPFASSSTISSTGKSQRCSSNSLEAETSDQI